MGNRVCVRDIIRRVFLPCHFVLLLFPCFDDYGRLSSDRSMWSRTRSRITRSLGMITQASIPAPGKAPVRMSPLSILLTSTRQVPPGLGRTGAWSKQQSWTRSPLGERSCVSPVQSLLKPERDIHERNQHRHLDKWSDPDNQKKLRLMRETSLREVIYSGRDHDGAHRSVVMPPPDLCSCCEPAPRPQTYLDQQ